MLRRIASIQDSRKIRVGSGANRGAPFWGFSLELKKWAYGPFFVCQEKPWLSPTVH